MKGTPLPRLQIKADMVLKGVSLSQLAKKAKVNYSVASAILSGTRIDEDGLQKLKTAIQTFPTPKHLQAA